jgi:hypothetical protein
LNKGKDDPVANEERQEAQVRLNEAREAIEQLNAFYQVLLDRWASPKNQVLGKVILSPPIGVGVVREGYTEDWAVIEVDASKIDIDNFNGNAIDLGTQISDQEFAHKMNRNPHWQNVHPFTFPPN